MSNLHYLCIGRDFGLTMKWVVFPNSQGERIQVQINFSYLLIMSWTALTLHFSQMESRVKEFFASPHNSVSLFSNSRPSERFQNIFWKCLAKIRRHCHLTHSNHFKLLLDTMMFIAINIIMRGSLKFKSRLPYPMSLLEISKISKLVNFKMHHNLGLPSGKIHASLVISHN